MSATDTRVAIRWAETADEARLAEIDTETWSPLVTPAPPRAEPVFFRPHVEPTDTLVAEVEGRIAGYAPDRHAHAAARECPRADDPRARRRPRLPGEGDRAGARRVRDRRSNERVVR